MRRSMLLCCAALFLAACGGSDSSVTGTNNNGNTGGTLNAGISATIDGKAWVGASAAVVYKNSIISFAGTELASLTTVSVATGTVTGPGTFPLGLGTTNAGIGLITQNSASWSTSGQGGTGTLVITTLTANHLVATFSFTAPALTNGATGTRQVTNGKIDATF